MTLAPLCCDASRMAVVFALRRDWSPKTQPWQPWVQQALFETAMEIDATARAEQEHNPFEEPS